MTDPVAAIVFKNYGRDRLRSREIQQARSFDWAASTGWHGSVPVPCGV